MAQVRIPTPDVQPDGRVLVAFGKLGYEFPSVADANREVEELIGDERDLLKRLALLIGKRRPATRGKTLTFDLTATTNLLTVS